ncbi:MAG: hypothetical protein MK110_14800 [Fuerstiella sp.]|nr:hypothetical protein [Fuerstiella sp.]
MNESAKFNCSDVSSNDVALNSVQRRQFVLLEHDHPFLHWDFLIEDGAGLASWRLHEMPRGGKLIPATALTVHRRHYLTWEGPVSGDRGHVSRLFSGFLELRGQWPDVSAWPGVTLRMLDCSLAEQCRLMRNQDETLYWEFV